MHILRERRHTVPVTTPGCHLHGRRGTRGLRVVGDRSRRNRNRDVERTRWTGRWRGVESRDLIAGCGWTKRAACVNGRTTPVHPAILGVIQHGGYNARCSSSRDCWWWRLDDLYRESPGRGARRIVVALPQAARKARARRHKSTGFCDSFSPRIEQWASSYPCGPRALCSAATAELAVLPDPAD